MKASRGRLGLAMLAALVLLPCFACGGNDAPQVVSPNVRVSLGTYTADIDQGATQKFTASVTGSSNTGVVWSILEGASGGSIDSQGQYTAPFKAGSYHIVATSAQAGSAHAIAEVYVRSVFISISPGLGDMEPGETQQFTANVTGTVIHDVTWSINASACGSITASGLYTAPASLGSCTLTATHTMDTSAVATASVRVANVSVAITPAQTALASGGMRSFNASVAGTLDDAVLWSVQEGAAGGVITELGIYTAPEQIGEYHVIASSLSHPGVIGTAVVNVVQSKFVETGSMAKDRIDATATLLPSGEVLIIGGYNDAEWESLTSAEIYDPATETFRTTGSMLMGRDGHTATPLLNGKILIVGGGYTYWFSHKSAELYDPTTGIFTTTGNMAAQRTHHTATRLQDGKVLILGGIDVNGDTDSRIAELYDPETGTFSTVGSMNTDRWDHTASLLDDQRVLIIGGNVSYYSPSSPVGLIYDPQTRTFTETGSPDDSRISHAATRIAGNSLLITGGFTFDETVEDYEVANNAHLVDLTSFVFKPAIAMAQGRAFHTSTLMQSGQVLIAGGSSSQDENQWWQSTDTAELFDPTTSKFTMIGPMRHSRSGHTATLLSNGRVLITGGTVSKVAELYIP